MLVFKIILFSASDIYLNHELITTKSSDSDYFISEMIFLRDTFDEEYIKSSMSISGIFSNRNRDRADFTDSKGDISVPGAAHIAERRQYAETIVRDGVTFYKYNLIACINHGLARQEIPLPSGIILVEDFLNILLRDSDSIDV